MDASVVKMAQDWLDGNCPGKYGKPTTTPDFIYFTPGELDALCKAVVDASIYVPQPSPIKTIPLIKRLQEQRDELAEAMRPLMALLREEEWHMRARRYAEPYSRAVSALDKCPTYEQQLRNVAEGIGMTYEELLSAFSRCEPGT